MTTSTTQPKRRRMAREKKARSELMPATAASNGERQRRPFKLDEVEAMLLREGGASIADMIEATGWQQHSVRGAMAGALKKRGLIITSEKVDGLRRYHAERQP